MRRPVGRSILAGVAGLSLLTAAACGGGDDKGETINIVENAWTASAVGAAILENLIENELGYQAEIVKIDENAMFAGLADGSLDLVSELWPSGVVAEEQAFLDSGEVVDVGPLGAVGQIGWFVPDYVVAENPALATWEGLKDPEVAKTFATAETGDLGRFLGTDPAYSTVDEPLVANLGLPFQVVYSGSEATTVAEIDSAVAAQEPIILYWWTPTAAVGKYNLVEVELPEYTEGCADVIEEVSCGYPSDPLRKLAGAGLEEKAPEVWAMFQNFTLTNEQQLELLPKVEIDQRPAAEVAQEWIDANEAIWSTWLS